MTAEMQILGYKFGIGRDDLSRGAVGKLFDQRWNRGSSRQKSLPLHCHATPLQDLHKNFFPDAKGQ